MKKNTSGLTLIELVVAVGLIWLLFLAFSWVNFNKNIDNQKANEFYWQILSHIETIKNYSLLWKWVGTNLLTPNKWTLRINNNNIQTYFQTGSTPELFTGSSVSFDNFENIWPIRCTYLDGSNPEIPTSIDIDIQGTQMIFTGSTLCTNNHKILEIQTNYKNISKKILINSVSGIIE